MTNPIPARVRGILYVVGIVVGGLAVVTGPLIIALRVSTDWAAVVTSTVGAVVILLGTLSRANLSTPAPEVDVVIGDGFRLPTDEAGSAH